MSSTAAYTEGSVFKHLSGLALTSAVGLFAIFVVDLVDMYFISLLGQAALAAAIGFAGLGLFLGASICIGASVAVSTLVAQAIGEEEKHQNVDNDLTRSKSRSDNKSRRLATHGLIYALCLTIPVTILTLVYAPALMRAIGASGDVLYSAVIYFRIVGASLPVLCCAFVCNGLLRSVGAGKMSMWTTLWGGIVNGVLDPLFIFTFGLGLRGAALASVVSRFTVAGIAFYDIYKKHRMFGKPDPVHFFSDAKELTGVALPSILTNLSAPISSAFATSQMAKFGTDAVAAASVIGRITPVLFAGIYGLSGAVGPVASQNFGAGNFQRVHETLRSSVQFVVTYVVPVAILMFFIHPLLAKAFSLDASAASLLQFYATFIIGSYLLFGLQLASNPMFTSLRHPGYATVSNIVRDLALAIPLIAILSSMFGAKGVLAGQALANGIAGLLAFGVANWLAQRVEGGESIDVSWKTVRLHHHWHVVPGSNHRGH